MKISKRKRRTLSYDEQELLQIVNLEQERQRKIKRELELEELAEKKADKRIAKLLSPDTASKQAQVPAFPCSLVHEHRLMTCPLHPVPIRGKCRSIRRPRLSPPIIQLCLREASSSRRLLVMRRRSRPARCPLSLLPTSRAWHHLRRRRLDSSKRGERKEAAQKELSLPQLRKISPLFSLSISPLLPDLLAFL